MRQLLIHIGYPKTATTTLQEEVFLGLHKIGKINYLGRTTRSTHTISGKSEFSGNDIVVNLRRHFILNEKLKFDKRYLSTEKLNVISDEDLTFHGYFQRAQFDVKVNPLDYPAKLKSIIGDDFQVQVLVTLRNQPDLIFSCYAQKYRFIRKNIGKLSFKEFLSKKDTTFFDLYRFDRVLDLYGKTFDAPVTVALFEDLRVNPDDFWETLSCVLPENAKRLKELANDKHYRKKDKSKGTIVTGHSVFTTTGKMLAPIFGGRERFMLKLDKRHHMSFSLFKKYEKKILLKFVREELTLPDEDDKNFLRKMFNDSNKSLAAKYLIDIERLKKYAYID